MIFGPPPFMAKSKTLVLIDRTTGTNIGDCTTNGGLSAAFDGNTSQVFNSSATRQSATTAYVGKTLAASRTFGQAICFGSTNNGYKGGSDPTVTLTMWGKQGTAPASVTDGTNLGSISFTDQTNESTGRTISSNDLSTIWDHLWLGVAAAGAGGAISVSELQLYAWE